ncbi:hypothetical protein [Chlorobium limicola]
MKSFPANLPHGSGDRLNSAETVVKKFRFRFVFPVLMVGLLLMPGGARTMLRAMSPHNGNHE